MNWELIIKWLPRMAEGALLTLEFQGALLGGLEEDGTDIHPDPGIAILCGPSAEHLSLAATQVEVMHRGTDLAEFTEEL